MSVQIIEKDGRQAFAVLPIDEYRALLEKAEMLDDVAAYDQAKAELANHDDEIIPAEVVEAILAGENPVRIWRRYRGLSQVELAAKAGISQAYLAQIENGRREGTLATYKAIANALSVDLDDLVE